MSALAKINPVLALPAAQAALAELEPAQLEALARVLYAIREEAERKAQESWKYRKGPMASYWMAAGAYLGHIARACRRLAK